jgi:hypothetical protein
LFEISYQIVPFSSPTDDEIAKVEMMRNLWSAHIFSLEQDICDLIGMLSGSSIVSLQRTLQRVAVQLADLSAPIAVFVVKAVLDALKKNVADNFEVTEKILAFLQTLMEQVKNTRCFNNRLNFNLIINKIRMYSVTFSVIHRQKPRLILKGYL